MIAVFQYLQGCQNKVNFISMMWSQGIKLELLGGSYKYSRADWRENALLEENEFPIIGNI